MDRSAEMEWINGRISCCVEKRIDDLWMKSSEWMDGSAGRETTAA